jgi:hypothetical protein
MEAVMNFARTAAVALALLMGASTFTGPAAANTYDQVPTRATLRVTEYNTAHRTVPVYRSAYAGRPYYRARVAYGPRPGYAVRPAYRYRAVRYGCPYGGCRLRY